jgi:hypothetical protein
MSKNLDKLLTMRKNVEKMLHSLEENDNSGSGENILQDNLVAHYHKINKNIKKILTDYPELDNGQIGVQKVEFNIDGKTVVIDDFSQGQLTDSNKIFEVRSNGTEEV